MGERDDDDDDGCVELVDAPCLGCGKTLRIPIDAEGDDACCGPACVRVVLDRMRAEIDAAYARYPSPGESADGDQP